VLQIKKKRMCGEVKTIKSVKILSLACNVFKKKYGIVVFHENRLSNYHLYWWNDKIYHSAWCFEWHVLSINFMSVSSYSQNKISMALSLSYT